jgi:flagellar basal-body rod modification protein FlgD
MIGSIAAAQTPATNTVAKPVGLADTFDTFLKLLTTQLQNQDPLSPLDTNQFTQQLVQFSQVEQTIKGNQTLQQLLATTQNAQFSNAAGYLGRTVSATTALQNVPSGQPANWNYNLGATGVETKLEVFSERGVKIFEAAGDNRAGAHEFVWDGKDSDGRAVPAGNYRLAVSALSAAGTAISSSVGITGRVNSLEVIEGVNRLLIGTTPVELSQINRVIAQ